MFKKFKQIVSHQGFFFTLKRLSFKIDWVVLNGCPQGYSFDKRSNTATLSISLGQDLANFMNLLLFLQEQGLAVALPKKKIVGNLGICFSRIFHQFDNNIFHKQNHFGIQTRVYIIVEIKILASIKCQLHFYLVCLDNRN